MTGITRGSKNVLADLGIEDAEELSIKMRLAVANQRLGRDRVEAAGRPGNAASRRRLKSGFQEEG